MLNPYQSLKEWLISIDDSELQDIAFLLSTSPYFSDIQEAAPDIDEMISRFLGVLNNYSEPNLKNVAFIVTFIALFDFYFESRSSESGWEEIENLQKSVLSSPDLTPSMKEHSTKMIAAIPERKKRWIDLYKEWNSLKNSALSKDNLDAWIYTGFQNN